MLFDLRLGIVMIFLKRCINIFEWNDISSNVRHKKVAIQYEYTKVEDRSRARLRYLAVWVRVQLHFFELLVLVFIN